MGVHENAFNQLYLEQFGTNKSEKKRFQGYLLKLQLKGLNDVRLIIKNDVNVLSTQIKRHCNMMDTKDLKRIMDLFENIKNDHFIFKSLFEYNGINESERSQIESNAIYSIKMLKEKKKKKKKGGFFFFGKKKKKKKKKK